MFVRRNKFSYWKPASPGFRTTLRSSNHFSFERDEAPVIRVTFKNGQVVSVTDGPLIQPFCRIKKESPDCSEDSKEAATYSPTCYCSTIGVNGLNFSVRNGKRWNPVAIVTLITLYCHIHTNKSSFFSSKNSYTELLSKPYLQATQQN